jgi:hypothetical protein
VHPPAPDEHRRAWNLIPRLPAHLNASAGEAG